MKFRCCHSLVLWGSLLAGLLAALGEWGRSPPLANPRADTLILATTVEPATLHPVFGADRMSAVEILGAVFEPLTVYDERRRLVPALATEIPTWDNGGLRLLPDAEARKRGGNMESIWHLRPDARWSDGVPVSADDFIFTFHLIKDADVPAISRDIENRIVQMEARDHGRTLVVLWREPYAFAHEGHRHLLLPKHIEEPRFQGLDDKKEYERTPFNRLPIGNGPYQVDDWSFGRHLVLKRQPFWHGPGPALERIVFRFIPEPETVLANLDIHGLGAVSPIALDYELAMQFHQRALEQGDSSYEVIVKPGLWWEHIDFNTENPITADQRVRQALTLGLNRQALCARLFPGLACGTDTWLAPVHPACFPEAGRVAPDLARYPFDRAHAAQLLDAAGWHEHPQGVRTKDGRELHLTLTFQAGDLLSERVAQTAKEDWRQLGVDLALRPVDAKKFGETSAASRAYQGLSLYPWIMDPSADGITFWTSHNIPTDDKPTGQNACRWRNLRSDDLLQQASQTLDSARRRDLLWQQQRIWAEELPAMPLFFLPEVSIRHRDLRGWKATGTDTPITWNCFEWRWQKGS
jgi:peptide/nickel transport system substrate-binding protein